MKHRYRRTSRATVAWWQAIIWWSRIYPGWPPLERPTGRRRIG